MRAAIVILLVAATGGCVDLGQGDVACGGDATVATPRVQGAYMQTDPRMAWQTVVLAPPANATATTTLRWSASHGWNASAAPLSAPGERMFQAVSVTPGVGSGSARLDFEVATREGACQNLQGGSVDWDLASPKVGHTAAPGQGAHVMTAGFLEDGTLFYTNIAEVDRDHRWPRVAWYAWEGDAPLPVYVYGQDRAEQPAHWRTPSGAVRHLLATDQPTVDGAVGDAATRAGAVVDGPSGVGYFTTIQGFNAALKEASTTTSVVARLAPEQAYTWPGNEAHALYGHALVFYIKVLHVVDAPCPAAIEARACAGEAWMASRPIHVPPTVA